MKNITDEKLFKMCKMYGKQAIIARRKFLGLLPEVNRRRLFEKRGFSSIFEFAFKMAGVSEEQVRDVLNLEKRFVDKPNLHKALVSGSVSANKLVRVAAIATTANEKVLVELAQSLPQKALELFVREERAVGSLSAQKLNTGALGRHENEQEINANARGRHDVGEASVSESNGLQTSLTGCESLRAQSFLKVELSEEVKEKLSDLQEKGLDVNAILLELLNKREDEIAEEKAKIGNKINENNEMPNNVGSKSYDKASVAQTKQTSRYIPIRIRQVLHKEYGDKCAIHGCNKASTVIHHTARFAIARNHNPQFLAPLCREHHVLAHTIDRVFGRHFSG